MQKLYQVKTGTVIAIPKTTPKPIGTNLVYTQTIPNKTGIENAEMQGVYQTYLTTGHLLTVQ